MASVDPGARPAFARRNQPRCPFCPERIAQLTPRLPPGIHGDGRIIHGEAVLFANLHAYSSHSCVSVYSPRRHYLPLKEMSERLIADNLAAQFTNLEADKGGLLGASAYATSLLRTAGDGQTQVTTAPPPSGYATTFGQTPWKPTAEVRFFRSNGAALPSPPGFGWSIFKDAAQVFPDGRRGIPRVVAGMWGDAVGELGIGWEQRVVVRALRVAA